jgi:hypothetical protein
LWALVADDSNRQGLAIDYPLLTMHGIVTHDPKYPEEHLVVIVQKSNDDDDDDSKYSYVSIIVDESFSMSSNDET